jgi:uncharacterized repeat protein (TIGR04052 family)
MESQPTGAFVASCRSCFHRIGPDAMKAIPNSPEHPMSRTTRSARAILIPVLTLSLAVSFVAASPAHSTAGSARADALVPITLRFRATVDTSPFACGTRYANIGVSHASIVASDFRFYVHDVRLVSSAGDTVRAALRAESPWADRDVALLDFENGTASCANGTPETRDYLVVMAPAGDYRGVTFTLGVPSSRNHEDLAKAPPPLSLSALSWSWLAGRKFMRVDMRATAADSAPTPWVIHLGSTGCTKTDSAATGPTSCRHPNRATISLAGLDPARDVVVADLAAILSRVDVRRNQPKTAAGCMSADSDADCGGLFASLGLPHASSTGADTPKFFRAMRADAARIGAIK